MLAPYVIGDPGRAALEVPAGPPGQATGSADAELSAATLPGLDIRAATVRGVHHRASGQPRQDAFALGRSAAGEGGGCQRAVAVVCDGVGADGSSHESALLISRHLVALATAGVLWPDAFSEANQAISAQLAAALLAGRDGAGGDLAATSATGLLVHRSGEDWIGETGWVGDSSLWHLSPHGQWAMLAGYQAEPTPGECAIREFRVTGGALFVMTDGVANPLRWSEEVRATLAQWWQRPPDPFTFAAQVGFARKSHMDDRTVVGIWPSGQ